MPGPGDNADFDPILDGAVAVLTPLMVQYAREELGFKTDLPYKLLNRDVSRAWEYGSNRQGYAGSLDDLQKARTLNPGLKVFIAHGYTDLATPYAVSRFLIGQLPPIESARAVEMRVYRGGHMMYMRPASRRELTADVRAVYGAPTSPVACDTGGLRLLPRQVKCGMIRGGAASKRCCHARLRLENVNVHFLPIVARNFNRYMRCSAYAKHLTCASGPRNRAAGQSGGTGFPATGEW